MDERKVIIHNATKPLDRDNPRAGPPICRKHNRPMKMMTRTNAVEFYCPSCLNETYIST